MRPTPESVAATSDEGVSSLGSSAGDHSALLRATQKEIGRLGALVSDPKVDDTTVAVALFDLGEFAVHYPQGRGVLQVRRARAAAVCGAGVRGSRQLQRGRRGAVVLHKVPQIIHNRRRPTPPNG